MSAIRTIATAGFTLEARLRRPYGIMPIGARQVRDATVAEVLHFQTCNAAGPYSAINSQVPPQVPPQVPVWQYVDPAERAHAARVCASYARATGAAA